MGMKYTRWTGRWLALAAVLASGGVAFSQSDPYANAYASAASSAYANAADTDDPQGAMLTIHKRVDEVNVLFIATDKHGKFVWDLGQTDFPILADHKPPQSIVISRRETDLPLHMGLLIDVSGSVH